MSFLANPDITRDFTYMGEKERLKKYRKKKRGKGERRGKVGRDGRGYGLGGSSFWIPV